MASFDSQGPTTFGWILIAILAVAALAAGLFLFLRPRRMSGQPVKAKRTADPVPPKVRTRLRRTHQTPAGLRAPRSGRRPRCGRSRQANRFTCLERDRTFPATRRQVQQGGARSRYEIEYEETLGYLAGALDRDYLLDILANPRLWEHPESLIRKVQEAVAAVDDQIVGNIRQVNAKRGLVFQVRLDNLRGARGAMDDWQRDFNRASGAE